MTRRAKLQNAFPRGVLDPDLYERIDLAHYYLALADARNQVALPQGGLTRRPGTIATRQRLRRRLEPVTLTAGMITAPNGGTIANLIDQDPATVFTTVAIVAATFIVAEINLGTPQPIVFVDVIGFRDTGANGRDDAFTVEWWDGSAWQPFIGSGDPSLSHAKALRGTDRTRRFGTAPGAHPVAQLFRLAFYGGGDGVGAFRVSGLRLWREQSALSPVEILDFAKTAVDAYELALTDRNIDVFRSGAYYASVPIPIGAEITGDIVWAQSLDTLILFHEDVDPQQIVRQGAHDEWNAAPAVFTNVPTLTTSTAFSGDQNEEQELVFADLTAGDRFVLFLGDAVTAPITYVDNPTLLTDLAAAIEALPGVNADDIVATVRSVGPPLTIRVTFVNLNGARRWPRLSPVVLEPSILSVTATVVQRGVDGDGPLMGATTGWPRCGVFNASRLLLGGFRSAPSTYAFSRVGLFFDYQTTGSPVTADLAVVNSIDSDKVETIQRIFIGTHVQVFTEEGEWYLENRVIDATQPINLVLSTSYGVAPNIAPTFVQGATLFIQSGGEVDGERQPDRVLRDMVFDFADRNNYTAEPLSLLAPHLLTDIADLAHRPGANAKEASLVLLLNRDGDFAMLTLLRSQEVTAMTPGDTAGRVAAIGADKKRNIWWAVEREAGGNSELWLERLDDSAHLDAQVMITGAPSATITNLGHLEGRNDVWVYADGDLLGPFTVAGAAITLAEPASEKIVGIAMPLSGRTLPLRETLQQAQPFRPPVRVYEVEWSLRDSGPFEMRANGGEWREVPIRHFDGAPVQSEATGEEPAGDLLDVPLLQRLYSGRMKIEGLQGWTRDGIIEWRQTTPAPFKLRAIRYQVAYR